MKTDLCSICFFGGGLWLVWANLACTSPSRLSDPLPEAATSLVMTATDVFPVGVYQHKVRVQVPGRKFPLFGVLTKTDSALSLRALSVMQTTIMTITDDLQASGPPVIEYFQAELQTQDESIRQVYAALRPFFLLSWPKPEVTILEVDRSGRPSKVRLRRESPWNLHLKDYDENAIPRLCLLSSEDDRWFFRIEVVDYELAQGERVQ